MKGLSLLALIDCNSFYCNCERIFRPELKDKPVVVLSNNDGCAVSRTPEAKALGIGMGAPYFQIKSLCDKHEVHIFSSNFSLYTDISRRVMNILKSFSPFVEVYSVDEAFIDLSGIDNPLAYAQKIKEEIARRAKIPVAIGIAPTKVLAKVACRIAKKDPQHKGVFGFQEARDFDPYLSQIKVSNLWGVAKGRSLSLKLHGIHHAKDFRDFSNHHLIQKILTKVGRQIQDELRGISCFPLTLEHEKKKEMMSSRTFGRGVFEKRALQESIASHASSVAAQLRLQNSLCYEVLVYVRTNPYKEGIIQYAASHVLRFQRPQNNTFALIKLALKALEKIWTPGLEYKKSGVRVRQLQDEHEYQLSLFEQENSHSEVSKEAKQYKEEKLMKVMDHINHREGKRTLFSLACGTDHHTWKMRRDFNSPRYTTSWYELPSCNSKSLRKESKYSKKYGRPYKT